jgi:hypothetical protein
MRSAVVVWGVLLVGAAAVVVALGSRGNEDTFRSAQSRALTFVPVSVLSGPRVAAAVSTAPEPVEAARRTPAVQTRCEPKGRGTLRNPWACTVRYRSGTEAHYLVQVQPDGSYSGVGTGLIEGCCVRVPTRD